MTETAIMVEQAQLHTLWRELTYELADVFDVHGVCAAIADKVASYTHTTTVVGVAGPQVRYYDVWICRGDGDIQQTRWDRAKASFEPFIEAGKAMFQAKYELVAPKLIHSELWQLPRDAILAAPLPMPGNYDPLAPLGVLCLIDPGPDCPLTLKTIEPLAANLTVFLDRACLRNQVDQQKVTFMVVSEIGHSLTSTLNLENIFRQLMGLVRRTLNVETISLGLIEPASGDIVFVNMLMGPLFENLPTIRLKPGQGIAGWVAKHRKPVIINDVYSDDRFYSKIDRDSGFRTHSMICIPLQVEERVIGVVQAINKHDSNFTESDRLLLQAISGPLAAAIENARLHNDVIAEKRRIETIFANMSEGLLTVNAEGKITHANDALLSLLHRKFEDIYGQPTNEVIELKKGALNEFRQQVIEAEEEYPQLATDLCYAPDTWVPVLISGAPIKNEDDEVTETIFVFSDLRQLREVERMRDDFFHGIIHELRTPLATILMYSRLLREGKAKEAKKADRFLGVIERESDRLQKMVRQMLQVAKMEAREFQRSAEPVYFNALFAEMLPPLADQAIEKGLTFRQRIEPNLPPVLGNEETFYLIFKNLIENAIKFTLSGTVRVEVWQENGMIHFQIEDEGIGIPQQALPNLFGRFFRAQTAVERGIAGTGLGLYMVKEGVEHYNGTIDVVSAENEGTMITVRLPAAET